MISIAWDLPVITLTFVGRWTWEQFYAFWKREGRDIIGADAPLCMIIDLTESALLPVGAVVQGPRVLNMMPDSIQSYHVVGNNNVFLRGTLALIEYDHYEHAGKVQFHDSLAAARASIEEKYGKPQE